MTCSAPSTRWSAGRRQVATTPSTPTNVRALSAKVASGPTATMRAPPSAGPSARATLKFAPCSSAAWGISSRATSSGWIAWNEGSASAWPTAIVAMSASSSAGVAASDAVTSASVALATSISDCAPSSSRRRSRMSPSAPAGITSRKTGSDVAVCTSATCSALPPRSPISHCAPTSCAKVPVFETNCAIHSARNVYGGAGRRPALSAAPARRPASPAPRRAAAGR